MKAFIIEFPIGGIITDGKELLFDNSNSAGAEYVIKNIDDFSTSSTEDLKWQLDSSRVLSSEQRKALLALFINALLLETEGWEFDEGGVK